jgi:hypothetical protein
MNTTNTNTNSLSATNTNMSIIEYVLQHQRAASAVGSKETIYVLWCHAQIQRLLRFNHVVR